MKRSVFLIVGCMLSLLVGAAPALADNGIHIKNWGSTPSGCAGCHRAHTAKAPFLLKEAQPALCFTCHGSSGTGSNLDVQDGVGYTGTNLAGESNRSGNEGKPVGALRGGGFQYALIDSSKPEEPDGPGKDSFTTETVKIPVLATGVATTSAHSVTGAEMIAWGNGAINEKEAGNSVKLTCGSCHDPHGNGNYRILRPQPVESLNYLKLKRGETSPLETTIPDVAEKVYTTENYGKMAEAKNPAFIENISKWCATCHTRYLAPSGSATTEPGSGDAIFTYRHTTEYLTHRPQCITCHVAHGSDATMSGKAAEVNNPNGTPGGVDSRLLRIDNRGVCQACHHK